MPTPPHDPDASEIPVSEHDRQWLMQAISLSARALTVEGGGPFGAVIVQRGEVIGAGRNEVTLLNDPTAHAEVQAIREACTKLGKFQLEATTLYTSCEPCPMCLGAILWARIERVVYANSRRQAALAGFDDESFYCELGKDVSERQLPMLHCEQSEVEAFRILKRWQEKTDRIPY